MLFGFVLVPFIGLVAVVFLVILLPAIIKAVGLSKYVDASAISFMKALLLAGAILFLIFNILRTIFY